MAPDPQKVLRKKRVVKPKLLTIERLFLTIGLKPFWTGLIFAALSIGFLTAAEIAAGRMDDILGLTMVGGELYLEASEFDEYGFFFAVVHLLLLALIPTGIVLVARAARRNAQSLKAFVEPSDDALAQLQAVGSYVGRGPLLGGLVGFVIGAAAPALDLNVWFGEAFNPYTLNAPPEVLLQRVLAPVFGFFVGQLLYVATMESLRFNRLASRVRQSELLEAATMVPFTRQGLTHVFVVTLFPAILMLFAINEGLAPFIFGICFMSLIAAVGGLLGPLYGIHARVAAAKHAQIAWVNKELAAERVALQGGGGERFVSLMAYRQYIESVKEWPLNGSTIGRLALYLAIPLFSWVGGALVERGIDVLLG